MTPRPYENGDTTELRRIDRSGEREKAKAEERRRLAEALRANLKRRKASRVGAASDAAVPAAPANEPPLAGEE